MILDRNISRSFGRTFLLLLLCFEIIIVTIVTSFSPTSSYVRQFRSMNNNNRPTSIRIPVPYLGSTKDKQKAVMFDPMPILTIYLSKENQPKNGHQQQQSNNNRQSKQQQQQQSPEEWLEMLTLLNDEKDPYKILQLVNNSNKEKKIDQKEIKRAYRRMARKFHPDMVDDDHKKIANELFAKINVAYDKLQSSATPAEMEEILSCDDAYKILQLSSKGRISRDEVKRAYRKLVMRYHPDVVIDVGDNKRLARKVLQKIHYAAESLLMQKQSFIQKGMGGAVHTSQTSSFNHRRTYKPPPCDGSASWGQRRPAYNTTQTDTDSATTTYVKAKYNRPPVPPSYQQTYQSQSTYKRPTPQSFYDKPPVYNSHQTWDTHWSNPRRHEAMEPTLPLQRNRFQAKSKSNDHFDTSYTPPHRASNTATGVNYNSSFHPPHEASAATTNVNARSNSSFRRNNAHAAPNVPHNHQHHPSSSHTNNSKKTQDSSNTEPSTTQGTEGSSTTNISGQDFEIRKLLWHIYG